jgi:hypothetical protein
VALPLLLLWVAAQDPQDSWAPLELGEPAPVDGDIHGPLADLDELTCVECHATIAAEWSTTLHAHAWVDPRYVKGLKGKRRPQSCHGCHAPEPLHTAAEFGRKPAPRSQDDARHLGIDCRSCHLGPEGVVLGPWGQATEAHASARSEHFVGAGSNELCSTCHQTNIGPVIGVARDFAEANLGERGLSCVGCHMAPVERAAATDADGRPSPVRAGRSHLLQTPRDPGFLAQAFAFAARAEGDETIVTVRNRAGHRVPGLIGREITLRARWPSDAGGDGGAEVLLDHDAYLPLEGTLELRLPGRAPTVLVRGLHDAPHLDATQTFLELELPVSEVGSAR